MRNCDGKGSVYWLAGLLEGEGWFGRSHHKVPCIVVTMTDEDVIGRAAALLGNKVVKQPKRVGKQAWSVSLYGHRAVEWLRVLQPLMGDRRAERIAELLEEWDARAHKAPKGRGSSPATCHPDKPVMGGGLCGTCYARRYRAGWRVRATETVIA
jgi:hypothetical protein